MSSLTFKQANTIYILTILNFLAQTNEVSTFVKDLGRSVHGQLVDLTKAATKDCVSALMHVEARWQTLPQASTLRGRKHRLTSSDANVIGCKRHRMQISSDTNIIGCKYHRIQISSDVWQYPKWLRLC